MKKNEYVRSWDKEDNRETPSRRQPPVARKRSQAYPFPLPVVYNMDDLAVMDDGEFAKIYAELVLQRDEVVKRKLLTTAWDEELAYLQREMRIRNDRRCKHRLFTDAINREISKFYEEEARLPEFVPNAPLDFLMN